MEILRKNNIGICFYSRFLSIGLTTDHSHDITTMIMTKSLSCSAILSLNIRWHGC